MSTETPKRVIDHPDVASIDEKQWLRERVKELEAAIELLKDPHAVWINMLRGTIGYPEHLKKAEERVHELEQEYEQVCTSNHSLEKEVAELRHKVQSFESQHNRKGPKFGEGFKVESAYDPMAVYGPVKMPPEFQHFTSGNTLPPKCAQCGRVL